MTTRDENENLYDSVSEPTEAALPATDQGADAPAGNQSAAPAPASPGQGVPRIPAQSIPTQSVPPQVNAPATPADAPASQLSDSAALGANAQATGPAAAPSDPASQPVTAPSTAAQTGPSPQLTVPAADASQTPGFHPGFGAVPLSAQSPAPNPPVPDPPAQNSPAPAPNVNAATTQPTPETPTPEKPAAPQFPTSMAGTVPTPPAPAAPVAPPAGSSVPFSRGAELRHPTDDGPRPGFMTAAELAARDGQPGGVPQAAVAAQGPTGIPGQPGIVPPAGQSEPPQGLGATTPAFLRTTSGTSTAASQQVTNEASGAAASVSSMSNMPVVAASTVFGADISRNGSARDDLTDTAVGRQQAIDPASADRERKAREEAARVKQEDEARRARERAVRERRLGTVAQQSSEPVVVEKPQAPSTDKVAPSLGLFLMRLIAAVMIGVYGYQALTKREPVVQALISIGVPRASMVTWGLSVLLLVMAVMLVFGFGTRVAGALTTVLAGLTLAFYRWGDFNPFIAGQAGFSGDIELLLAGIGLVFLLVGAGGWSIDGGMRRSRLRRKEEEDL